jgi:pseudouridine synthase
MSSERLQKLLSQAGISSRRGAEALILSGRVRVNGEVIRQLGAKADPDCDRIEVDGRRIRRPQSHRYYAYYKPRGVVVSKQDELGRKGVFDLLKLPKAVNAVGRLDKDSEGLLLLSDDGDWVHRYTHPSFGVSKVYRVQLSRDLSAQEARQLKTGILLDEQSVRVLGIKKIRATEGLWWEVELGEGIKREIRRLMEKFDIEVKRLIRVQHGSVRLGTLRPGELKILSRKPV